MSSTPRARASAIVLSTVGIGGDVNRSLLSEIADVGGGRSYFTADPRSIPRIFVRETTTGTDGRFAWSDLPDGSFELQAFAAGFEIAPVSVNVSSAQFSESDLQEIITSALVRHDVEPAAFEKALMIGRNE